jgi:RNA-binding protein YhbY
MAENKNNEGDEKDFFKKENKKSKIQIGKNGITQSLIKEIRRQLKTHEFFEVKLLK